MKNEWNDVEEKTGILARIAAISLRRKVMIIIYIYVIASAISLAVRSIG